jgi:pimeloyl-ACP methyl ester carboxylesterase
VNHQKKITDVPVVEKGMRGLETAVAPPGPCLPENAGYRRTIPLYTHDGVLKRHKNARASIYPFYTADGLGLSLTRFTTGPCSNVIVILHGLTTSSDMFIMPEHDNLVSYLLDNGYTDVWCMDSRMSNRFPYNLTRHRYTLDDVAACDVPAALSTVRREVGDGPALHVIAHCLGSLAFMMALYGKSICGITSAITNSISLHPRVPAWSLVKLTLFPFLVEYPLGLSYINPNSRYEPGLTVGRLVSAVADLFHRECACPSCHMLSFMWGAGFPALFFHENMDPITHDRLGDLFGGTSVHYYRHVRKMVFAKRAVKYSNHDKKYSVLPEDYTAYAEEIKTPVLFVMGEKNRVFADSNEITFKRLRSLGMHQHEFHVFPRYGHQDIFMGRNVATDIFPRFLQFLRKHSVP